MSDSKFDKAIQAVFSNNYEKAIEVSGILKYRSYFHTIWAKKVIDVSFSLFQSTSNYYRLISIELHSIVGDMLHIAKMNSDRNYKSKVEYAMRAQYQYEWIDSDPMYRRYSHYELEKVKVLEMPDECYNHEVDMKEAFIKMINFFQQWEKLQVNNNESDAASEASTYIRNASEVSNLYLQIIHEYCVGNRHKYAYEPYKQILLSKYRMQRKLDLNTQHFLVYNTKTYKAVWSKYMNTMSCQSTVINPTQNRVYGRSDAAPNEAAVSRATFEEERKKQEQLLHAAGYYYWKNQQKH